MLWTIHLLAGLSIDPLIACSAVHWSFGASFINTGLKIVIKCIRKKSMLKCRILLHSLDSWRFLHPELLKAAGTARRHSLALRRTTHPNKTFTVCWTRTFKILTKKCYFNTIGYILIAFESEESMSVHSATLTVCCRFKFQQELCRRVVTWTVVNVKRLDLY